jgi:phage tail sheath protein FI
MISNQAAGADDPVSPAFSVAVLANADVIGASTVDSPLWMLSELTRQNNLNKQSIGGGNYYVLETFTGFTAASLIQAPGQVCPFAAKINTSSIFIRVAVADIVAPGRRPSNTGQPVALGGASDPAYSFESAMQTVATLQSVSLLAMPDTVTVTDGTGKLSLPQQSGFINAGLRLCESLGSLFYVCDFPFGLDTQGVLSFKSGNGSSMQSIESTYGAVYYPWVWIFSPINSLNVPIPPSGPALGRYAYTDTSAGVFKSPAGVNDGVIRSAVSVESQLTVKDQELLIPAGINTIRNFINDGNVIWGARTLSSDSAWTYIAVRRLLIYVQQSLLQSLQWVVFEPNGPALWAQVSLDTSAFLATLWQQGGLFGSTASDAFFVVCDASNNPPGQGQLLIEIGLAAVSPAEFVVIVITQKTAGPGE